VRNRNLARNGVARYAGAATLFPSWYTVRLKCRGAGRRMGTGTSWTGPPPEADLLLCLAVIARALQAEFQPRAVLGDFSTSFKSLVPHDYLHLSYLAENRRTFSVFAEHGGPGFLPSASSYTTDLQHASRFLVAESPLATVFEGQVLCVADLQADPRFVRYREEVQAAETRSAAIVPVIAGSRVIGALSAASREGNAFGTLQVERMRSVAGLIGPFIEIMALLSRERRRRRSIEKLTGITDILGTTLNVGEILEPLGKVIRPALDFDAMGVVLWKPGSPEFVLFGRLGVPADPRVHRLTTRDYSIGEAVTGGRPVLIEETSTELDSSYAGDRATLASGLHSCIWVPMRFGDKIGGTLFFGKREPNWYDDVDVEVATVIATRIVLGIQHQRLAEEQRRLASAERRARGLEQSLKTARSELYHRYGFEQMIGQSRLLRETLGRAVQVARTETTVLVTGESGTGKELVARAIHYASPRADGPFIAVNCAALPDTLLESELFGHERGAFTGADRQKPGRFELAARGTLFLDEIGELSPSVQVKLLRVLQEREFQRVGGTATLKADVRLIAATNRDLSAEMTAGRFRTDLFYRLAVFNVHLPPLRERGGDVLLLADAIIRNLAPKMGKSDVTLSLDACDVLRRHPWPGNIRELQNAIERGLITCEGSLVTAAHLAISPPVQATAPLQEPEVARSGGESIALQELEREAIIDALQRTRGHKARAARLLGLTRFQLYNRLKRYHIEVSTQ
jgi:Nif-specific regulatory protein